MPNHSLAIMRIYVFNVQIYGVFNVVDTVCIDYVDPLIHGIGKDYLREYCFVSVLPSLASGHDFGDSYIMFLLCQALSVPE